MTLQISVRQFWSLFLLAVIGLSNAVYLTMEHYMNATPPCYAGSCETVLTSPYAVILGIPVAVWGVVYYGVVLAGLWWYQNTLSYRMLQLTLLVTVAGLLSSFCFFLLMTWVIGAWCQYCVLSGMVSLFLFLLAMQIVWQSKTVDTPQ